MTRPAPEIRFEGVSRRWGDRVALGDLSLAIPAGERVALIGPSGSGKTTLLRLLNGALATSAGRVLVDDRGIGDMSGAELRRHRQRCGLVDQGSLLIPQLSVHANVTSGMLAGWPWYRTAASLVWPLERQRVRALLDEVGLADRQWDRADILSGGQKQRVAIARALAAEPTILLADEPTGALDPTTAREVTELLSREAARRSATLIVSTHRVSQVIGEVDRVVGLREGALFCDRAPGEVDDALLDALYAGSRERI